MDTNEKEARRYINGDQQVGRPTNYKFGTNELLEKRIEKAKIQLEKEIIEIEDIIKYTLEFLALIGIRPARVDKKCFNPIIKIDTVNENNTNLDISKPIIPIFVDKDCCDKHDEFSCTKIKKYHYSYEFDCYTRIIKERENCRTKKNVDDCTWTNEFNGKCYFRKTNNARRQFYCNIKHIYGLDDVHNIVWMPITQGGHLAIVAKSSDIDLSLSDVIKGLYQESNCDEVIEFPTLLVFPLKSIPTGMTSGDVEKGIGNYLIKKYKVPILDYYSHLW